MKRTVRVRVPATTANLGPGFDVLGAALKLYNEIEVSVDSAGSKTKNLTIEISGEGEKTLPTDKRNVVWQSMTRVFSKAESKSFLNAGSIKIKLKNNIPLGSGLGSSAAARLGGILAANELIKRKLSREKILSLGVRLEGHPDNIVPALVGGFCVSVLNDNNVKYVKLPVPNLKAIVCIPDFELLTGRSRKVLPKRFSRATMVFNCSRLAMLMAALQTKNYELLDIGMEDKLHQPSRQQLIPGMKEILTSAKKAGAYGAALSGAGPSIVAFGSRDKAAKIGESMKKKWQQFNISSRYLVLNFDVNGASASLS